MDAMGLGWVIMMPEGDRPLVIQKAGGTDGIFSYIAFAPTRGVGVFISINQFRLLRGIGYGPRRQPAHRPRSRRADARRTNGSARQNAHGCLTNSNGPATRSLARPPVQGGDPPAEAPYALDALAAPSDERGKVMQPSRLASRAIRTALGVTTVTLLASFFPHACPSERRKPSYPRSAKSAFPSG